MKESDIYEQLAQYMNLQYPQVMYHFDLAGVNNPSRYTRNMYGRLNKRAWPDLFVSIRGVQHIGLFIEIKNKSPYLKDGITLKADEHLREQALVLEQLQACGYKAVFGTGFDECKQIIDEYLT